MPILTRDPPPPPALRTAALGPIRDARERHLFDAGRDVSILEISLPPGLETKQVMREIADRQYTHELSEAIAGNNLGIPFRTKARKRPGLYLISERAEAACDILPQIPGVGLKVYALS